ncbi:DUF1800 domain-containing protein [Aquipseudomonas alcaligenes]|uniref:DUF1800 domain-containing protein n=1 Tax=Aquipseudomonas alcaligenes TaxID=43263 RepID=A0A2V4LQL9_AQUAC|nr:DUF1800 family protein [Pseudomonas alcaligenes]PYC20206.1 DUF1800 domain-containing protein [Pseudomonas alcaligenes]
MSAEIHAVEFLNQATFGAKVDEVSHLLGIGLEQWFEEQKEAAPTLHFPKITAASPGIIDRTNVWMHTALTAPDQLRQRVAFALSQLMVVSDRSDRLITKPQPVANYYDILVRHAFGNYRELLEEVTLSPVMGEYLSMKGNRKASISANIRPDENYAREIMQLFSLGISLLNEDGTVKLDGNGRALPTYTQQDIQTLARIFTGWHFKGLTNFETDTSANWYDPMEPYALYHDTGAKQLLNCPAFPAGRDARAELEQVLDCLFMHPNTPVFVSKHLIGRLVTTDPSGDYVRRVSAVFRDNGAGVRGDLFAVVKAILTDAEASLHDLRTTRRAKEPLLKVTQLWRFFEAQTASGRYEDIDTDWRFYQAPLRSPSVFNFFPADYTIIDDESGERHLLPELFLLDEHALTQTTNLITTHLSTWWKGSTVAQPSNRPYLDLSRYNNKPGEEVIPDIDKYLLFGTMSDLLRDYAETHVGQVSNNDINPSYVAREALMIILNSPEFSVQ